MFAIVILLYSFSSYLISSVLKNFLTFFVAFFALIVLNMELLSLFHQISALNILIFGIIDLILSFSIFKIKKAEFLKINFDFKRFFNSLLLDKNLLILSISFLCLISVTLYLALIMPVLEPDSQTYHFMRAYDFVKFKSLNHFEINDFRALVMPINSEIIYSWLLLFKKNLYGYGIVTYCSFWVYLCALWQIFEKFKFCFRKRLFTIFVFSSFSSIIVQIPSLQTDIIVGSLVALAFALYLNNSKILTYFSSLALALAFGVKSTGVMMGIGFFVLLFLVEKVLLKTKNYKKIKEFFSFLVINFIVFSSYNYILNFLQFGNFLASDVAISGHRFWGGFKGYISNLINFAFQSLDFTGFKWGYYLNYKIIAFKNHIFDFLNWNNMIGCNVEQEKINIIADEQIDGFGILGFLVFIPCLVVSFIKPIFNKNKRTILLFVLSLIFIVNILILARAMAYMVYSIRFVISFVCLCAPILVYSYSKRNILKYLAIPFCLFYMTLLPFCIKRMPFFKIQYDLKLNNYNHKMFVKDCYNAKIMTVWTSSYVMHNTIEKKYPNAKKIAVIKSLASSVLYLTDLENKGRTIDFPVAALITPEKLEKYDLVVLEGEKQDDDIFTFKEVEKKYKVKDNAVIFKDNKSLNCYYTYKTNLYDNLEPEPVGRECLTYYYFKNLKNLKLDYKENAYEKENKIFKTNETLNIYYYLKSN